MGAVRIYNNVMVVAVIMAMDGGVFYAVYKYVAHKLGASASFSELLKLRPHILTYSAMLILFLNVALFTYFVYKGANRIFKIIFALSLFWGVALWLLKRYIIHYY